MAVLQKSLYIHGYDRDRTEAGEELDRVQKSLIHNNYTIDLIGFSWNSNTGAIVNWLKRMLKIMDRHLQNLLMN